MVPVYLAVLSCTGQLNLRLLAGSTSHPGVHSFNYFLFCWVYPICASISALVNNFSEA